MNYPKFSVIIPSYNGAEYLPATIQSVLNQTYQDYELIIVDDASLDDTKKVINGIDDPRLRYIVHSTNQGANVARNTGIRAASGDVIAFLDQDDLFHPEKLQKHAEALSIKPNIGFTYNARFELNPSSDTIRDIWRPPEDISLTDLVIGYPMSPSDMVVNRDWIFKAGFWDESGLVNGAEITFAGRLFLSGCKFAYVGKALNYRRYYSGRIFNNLDNKCMSEVGAREKIFSDSRCPKEVLNNRNIAMMNAYLDFAYLAFVQEEFLLGQEFLRKAIQYNPDIITGNQCQLTEIFLYKSISDENQDHGELLNKIFTRLPSELEQLLSQYEPAIARGYLLKGVRALLWGRPEVGDRFLSQAITLGAQIDESFLSTFTAQLLSYELEFGAEAAQTVIRNMSPYFDEMGERELLHWLIGCYSINQAFRDYRDGNYSKVPREVIRAILNHPQYLLNQGALSILFRSIQGITSANYTRQMKSSV